VRHGRRGNLAAVGVATWCENVLHDAPVKLQRYFTQQTLATDAAATKRCRRNARTSETTSLANSCFTPNIISYASLSSEGHHGPEIGRKGALWLGPHENSTAISHYFCEA